MLDQAAKAAQAVCRVENKAGMGTGFLIGPNLVLTNHHVVPTAELATKTKVRFGYRRDQSGKLHKGERYQVLKALQRSSIEDLDYVVLEVEGSPGEKAHIGYLEPLAEEIELNSRLYIIQHPKGAPQQVVLHGNKVTYVADDQRRVQYMTNTERGSSGSPVFNEWWEVVALHHSARPTPEIPETIYIRGNEGIPTAAILPEIQDLLP